MMLFPDPQKDATHEAVTDPHPGDRFSEMMTFHLYVLAVEGDVVTTLEASGPCTLPEDGLLKTMTKGEFRDRLSYKSGVGYWVRLVERECDVQGWLETRTQK
jgi:hypothetical protein